MRGRSSILMLVVVGGVGASVACGDTSSGPVGGPPPAEGNVAVLGERSEQVTAQASNAAVVMADRVVFPGQFVGMLAKKPGDILISDRQAAGAPGKNPLGFVRKVKSVSRQGDQIVVETETANLAEAFQRLTFRQSFDSPALTESGPVAAEPGLRPQGGKTIELLNFSGKSLFDVNEGVMIDGKNIGFHAFAKVNKGTLNFKPKFDVGADVSFGFPPSLDNIKSVHASATGTLEAELELNAGVKLTTDIDSETFTKIVAQKIFKAKDATLADYDFDLGSMAAGPIAIPVNAHFKAVLACDFVWAGGAEVVVGAKGSASVTAGFKYENKELKPVFDKGGSLEQIGPNWTLDGLVRVKCSIRPSFEIKVWDLAMAEVWANGYASLSGSLACGAPAGNPPSQTGTVSGEAYAGVRSGVKVKVDIFGLVKYNKECTLFDLQSPKASYSKTFTLPGGNKATCSGDLPAEPEEPPAPEKCFGSGSGAGGSSGGGTGGGCDPTKTNDVSSSWTCEAAKWNDCKCDCGCGAKDPDCKDGECSSCGHDLCTTGDPLGTTCFPCLVDLCAADPYCCEEYWGPSCFAAVEKHCGMKCPQLRPPRRGLHVAHEVAQRYPRRQPGRVHHPRRRRCPHLHRRLQDLRRQDLGSIHQAGRDRRGHQPGVGVVSQGRGAGSRGGAPPAR